MIGSIVGFVAAKKAADESAGHWAWYPGYDDALEEELAELQAEATIAADIYDADCKADAPTHSDDFRSINWFGKVYYFTANRASVIRVLWQNWKRGTPEVGSETLLDAVDPQAPPNSLRNLFRNDPALDVLIVPGSTKGSYRLAEPKNPLRPEIRG